MHEFRISIITPTSKLPMTSSLVHDFITGASPVRKHKCDTSSLSMQHFRRIPVYPVHRPSREHGVPLKELISAHFEQSVSSWAKASAALHAQPFAIPTLTPTSNGGI